jgi:hypothetical protein
MFGWLKRKKDPAPPTERAAHQPPGEVFPWPKGWRITAIDEAVIAVPAAILSANDVIGSVIHCDDEVRLNLPVDASVTQIQIWLKPGQSVWLSKSCQAVVLAMQEGDAALRRFTLAEVGPNAKPSAPADRPRCAE